jgi:hypothetical protein
MPVRETKHGWELLVEAMGKKDLEPIGDIECAASSRKTDRSKWYAVRIGNKRGDGVFVIVRPRGIVVQKSKRKERAK